MASSDQQPKTNNQKPSTLFDISPPITEHLAVWPGDTPVSRQVLLDMRNGDNLTLSTLHATVHLGAHADAPNHYGAYAPAIEKRSLEYYLGPCQVIHVKAPRGVRILPEDVKVEIVAERVLLRTNTFPDPEKWNDDFAALSTALVDAFHEHGVILVGIDTPSVDPSDSRELPAHGRFLEHDMAILEGLVLKDVPEGVYELIALPLKLVGFDASPVRAILRSR